MKIKQCMSCKGAGKIMGMGFMGYEKCRTCAGIGHVPDIEDMEIDALLQTQPKVEPVVIAAPVVPVKKVASKPATVAKKK